MPPARISLTLPIDPGFAIISRPAETEAQRLADRAGRSRKRRRSPLVCELQECREVRSGAPQVTTVKARDANVLIQRNISGQKAKGNTIAPKLSATAVASKAPATAKGRIPQRNCAHKFNPLVKRELAF